MFKSGICRTALTVFCFGMFHSLCFGFDLESPVKAIVFEDDFESITRRPQLYRWVGKSPAWTVVQSTDTGLIQEDTRPVTRQVLYAPGRLWKDYSLTCLLRVERWGGQTKSFAWSGTQYRRVFWSVALRTVDAANCYRLEYAPWVPDGGGLKQSYYRLVKYTGGKRVELARVLSRFHSDLEYRLRFEAQGTKLRARVWPASEPEPVSWTIEAEDRDHAKGSVSFLTVNTAVIFDKLLVRENGRGGVGGAVLLEVDFDTDAIPEGWEVLSGSWRIAPKGMKLERSGRAGSITAQRLLAPDEKPGLPAAIHLRMTPGDNGLLCLALAGGNSEPVCRLNIGLAGAACYGNGGLSLGEVRLGLETGREYSLTLNIEEGSLGFELCPYPFTHRGEVRR
ncbi:MAG: hypothetical protein U9N45_06345, partial [Gemmatimonadota bacterium]|nr:hypothetical protein [Gemmatimonadota bacterium]